MKKIVNLDKGGDTRINIIQKAKNRQNDEFYTCLKDVEKELNCYDLDVWKDKVIFCNCNDAAGKTSGSAFALYFISNFSRLKLKKLICTSYSKGADLFNDCEVNGSVFTKDAHSELVDYPKNYNGSFDHPLSIHLLTQADIVCTNPPFSIAIDFWKLLMKHKKKFIIISNILNPISTWCIPYFAHQKVWSGYNRVDEFLNDKGEIIRAAGCWYTNIPIKNRPQYKHLKICSMSEIPEECKRYDDAGTLLVDKYIPNDYEKPFGVSARPILNGVLEKGYVIVDDKQINPMREGKVEFKRVLIQKFSQYLPHIKGKKKFATVLIKKQ